VSVRLLVSVVSEVFGREFEILVAVEHLRNPPLGLFCHVHGGIGGAQQAVFGGAVRGVEGQANAGRTLKYEAAGVKRVVEGAFEAERDLLDIGTAARNRNQHHKLGRRDYECW